MLARAALLVAALLAPGPAFACTLCHSDTADRVRAALLGTDLLANAAAVLAPVPLLLAAIWLVPELARGR